MSSPDSMLKRWWRGQDSNLRSPLGRQFYRLLRLTTPAPLPILLFENSIPQSERGFEPANLSIRAREPSRLSLLMTEPERGLEPTDLRFTKPLLCQLSYSGISDIITEREIGINNHLMPADAGTLTDSGAW